MHKETLKKLTLSKETLRNLSIHQLTNAAGGVRAPERSYTDCTSCRPQTEPTSTCI
jgi:hypothetical protein